MPKPQATPSINLAKVVKLEQEKRNWTAQRLSREAGLASDTIRSFLTFRSGISVYVLEQIAFAYNLRASTLLAKAEKYDR